MYIYSIQKKKGSKVKKSKASTVEAEVDEASLPLPPVSSSLSSSSSTATTNIVATASSSTTPPANNVPTATTVEGGKKCTTCGGSFLDTSSYRAHFRSNWHIYNLKEKMKPIPQFLTEKEFMTLPIELQDAIKNKSS